MNTADAPLTWHVSASPHIRQGDSTGRIMWTVTAALVPAAIMSVVYFGAAALTTLVLCMATAAVSELLYRKLLKKKSTIGDGSALLTGLLLAFNLPPTAPIFIPILGSVIAIVLAKQLFGGLGCNIFNPALVARAILFVSFPTALSTWKAPSAIVQADAISAATPLSMLKVDGMDKLIDAFGGLNRLYQQLLIGQHAGSLGETCVLALAIGGIFLLIRGIITWHIPVSFLGTAALLAWIFGGSTGLFTGNPLIHILSGGIVLGAFFMATDYVTAPMLGPARLLFGAGCGCITMLIRLKGGYPEGVMFSILIMNCFAPLLDRIFRDPGFGAAARKEAAR